MFHVKQFIAVYTFLNNKNVKKSKHGLCWNEIKTHAAVFSKEWQDAAY